VLRIHCIECDTVKEVEVGRGRPRYFCDDPCRLKAYRKSKLSTEAAEEYARKRAVIDKQYRDARRTSRSPASLRRRAMSILSREAWSIIDIALLFNITEQRVRNILGKEGKPNGK